MVDNAVLIERAQAGEKEARKVLIEQNLGLVHHIVKRFTGRGIEAEDLFQIGTIGLMKSIDKFDTHFEVKFSTYAVPLIAGEIRWIPSTGLFMERMERKFCSWISSNPTERKRKSRL